MKIKTKILWTVLSMSLLVALVGALAVDRQRASASVAAVKEAENVARVLSLLESDPKALPASIQQIIVKLHQTQGRDVTLVDSRQTILADAIPAEIGTNYQFDQHDEVGQTIKDGKVRTFVETSKTHPEGIKQIVVPVDGANGQVIGAVILEYTPLYNELFDLTRATTRQVIAAGLGGVAIAFLIAFYMGRSIAVPLQQLTNAATRFAAGEADLALPRTRRDEVGELSNAFHHMVQKRREAEEALRRAGDELEARVEERTAQLADANSFLQFEVVERRAAEEAARASEQRFREIAESIHDVFWVVSPDSSKTLYVSPGFEKIWGRTCASAYEQPQLWYEAIVPEDRANAIPALEKGKRGEKFEMEFRITRPDGSGRSIYSRGFPVKDEAGNVQRIVGLATDVTARKRMEEKLFEAGKLETVGRLAGGIAHDFNTILTTIIGHADLIGQAVPADSAESRSAEQIGKSAERAAHLTQQLLAFSRKQMLQPETLDLNAVVTGIEPMLLRLLGDGIETRVAINAKRPWAKADAGQIEQMLVQLALNAQDAMPRGGRLTLETADITLDETYAAARSDTAPGEYVMIAITDTGAGIPDEVKPRIFEPFFTTKPQGEGTGLGLSMCYGIAKQIGGHIGVYSELGRGTTFKVLLPRVAAPSTERSAAAPMPRPTLTRGRETVLLVEDDDALRGLAGIVLKKLGYAVYSAAGSAEAMSIAQDLVVDLLLTDVVMPKMSGKELADQLRASQPGVKVLFTSAYTEEAIVHHGILDPGIDFLHKPYTPALLSRKTREALDAARPSRAFAFEK